MNKKYPQDVQERAVAIVDQRRIANPRDRTIFREVAVQCGVGEQSLRLWVRKFDATRLANINGHALEAPQSAIEEGESELEALRRRIQKLQAENDVLKRAFVVFSSEWTK